MDRSLRLVDDRIAQDGELLDLDLDDIAGLHPERWSALGAHAAGRAADDDVTGLEPGESRAIFDLPRDIEDHVLDLRFLHDLPVEAGDELELGELAELVRRHLPRAERAGVGKILAWRELVSVALEVADAAVVVAGVAGNKAHRLAAGDVAAALADDDRELALEIEIGRDARPDDGLQMPGLTVGVA